MNFLPNDVSVVKYMIQKGKLNFVCNLSKFENLSIEDFHEIWFNLKLGTISTIYARDKLIVNLPCSFVEHLKNEQYCFSEYILSYAVGARKYEIVKILWNKQYCNKELVNQLSICPNINIINFFIEKNIIDPDHVFIKNLYNHRFEIADLFWRPNIIDIDIAMNDLVNEHIDDKTPIFDYINEKTSS
ncbi:unnamed protein product [marine sediment metagenome]|uniref:Ankyrin repeat protein n=1 Tax=marine sediment metagenome TaxID=412755 RepID=X0YM30_9ZZZZ